MVMSCFIRGMFMAICIQTMEMKLTLSIMLIKLLIKWD